MDPVGVPLVKVNVGDAFALNLFPTLAPEAIDEVIQKYPVEPLLIVVANELNVTVEPDATPDCVVPICDALPNVFDVALKYNLKFVISEAEYEPPPLPVTKDNVFKIAFAVVTAA